MGKLETLYNRLVAIASSHLAEGLALLATRVALAGVFWRSGRTKVEDGTLLEVSETTYFLFDDLYSGVPIPSEIAAPMATYAEFFFPILLVLGFATRFASVSLLLMTLVIQFFVFPEAWWAQHVLWFAMAAILISRGGGVLSADALVNKVRAK